MRFGVVVVTHDRVDKLRHCLELYEVQRERIAYCIVIDNKSVDGTKEYLDFWAQQPSEYERIVIHMKQNNGGSAGFYEGLHRAIQKEAAWVWVSDDDAYPGKDTFQILEYQISLYQDTGVELAAICGCVFNEIGIDTWHRRRLTIGRFLIKEENIPIEEYKYESFEIDLFSYVGVALKREALLRAGLPNKDFFISYDDTEHSMRIAKYGKILCLPQICIYHDSPVMNHRTLTWKKYYTIRNKLYTYSENYQRHYCIIMEIYYLSKAFTSGQCEFRMVISAILDARKKRLGVHELYRPGWNNNK